MPRPRLRRSLAGTTVLLALNETGPVILGEPVGTWVLGVLTAVASIFAALAAWWASSRANKIAAQANKIGNDALAAQAVLAEQQWSEDQVRLLDSLIREMAHLAAKHPLTVASESGQSSASADSSQLRDILGAYQAYSANMGRAKEVELRLKDRGYKLRLRGGRQELFLDLDFKEHDKHGAVLRGLLEIDSPRDVVALVALQTYWNQRSFNLPWIAGVERQTSPVAAPASQ